MSKNKKVIILIGPPGAGKGTQADMLAEKFCLFHLETSNLLESAIKDANPNDPEFLAAKEAWKTGKLVAPSTVVRLTVNKIRQLAAEEQGLALSGSPRTLFEAEKEMPVLEELYGRENIKALRLILSEEESVNRNSHRRICRLNRHPIPNFPEYLNIQNCPKDGSEIVLRGLDKPDIIRIRYKTFLKETEPVVRFLADNGYYMVDIKGEQPINKVFDDINEAL